MCDKCVEWNGKMWHRYGDGGHYKAWFYLHREIWESVHGPIPPGYQVHHINGDKEDNRIENLELLSHSEHSARHIDEKIGPYRAKAYRNAYATRIKNHNDRLENRVLVCTYCGKEYRSGARNPIGYCSRKCIDAARTVTFEGEQRMCQFCGKPYAATKRTQKYCSKLCSTRAFEERKKAGGTEREMRNVTCEQCGQVS